MKLVWLPDTQSDLIVLAEEIEGSVFGWLRRDRTSYRVWPKGTRALALTGDRALRFDTLEEAKNFCEVSYRIEKGAG